MNFTALKIEFPDGMFSAGGAYGRRSKTGKAWARLQDIKSHLTMVDDSYQSHPNWPYADARIVGVMIENNELRQWNTPVSEFFERKYPKK